MTAPGTAEDPEELAVAICRARARYLRSQKMLIGIGKIQDWQRATASARNPIAGMRAGAERQLDTLAPSIRQAEAGLAAMVPPAVMEDLLAKAQAEE